jgi:hypothetical protein
MDFSLRSAKWVRERFEQSFANFAFFAANQIRLTLCGPTFSMLMRIKTRFSSVICFL